MALRKVNTIEMELNFFKDSMWRLTNRVYVIEEFITKKFGDVLNCCNVKSGQSPKSTNPKRKKPNLRIRKRSPINLRNKKAKVISSSDSEEEIETPSNIKTEHFSEPPCSDEDEDDESDPYESPNEIQFHSPPTQGDVSNNECEEEDDIETYILPGGPPEAQQVSQGKTSWIHVNDFPDRETAEAELSSEWSLKYTLTDADGMKSTYDCKHEIGTCPAKLRLVSLNNIGSVTLLKNNADHVHSEDAKYGFNFPTKKIIDSLIAQGVTELEPMMKALVVRNIVVGEKFVNRYLGRHKKQLGLFNKSPTAKRLSYTVSFKLQVVGKAEKVGNKEAAREYNIDESNVRNWRKCKSVLEKLEPQRSSLRGKRAKWPDLEKELAMWISGQKEAGEKITTELIRQEAAKIAQRLHLSDFSSSKGWLERFTKRLGESFARRKAKKRVTEETTTMTTPEADPLVITPLTIFPSSVSVSTTPTSPANVIANPIPVNVISTANPIPVNVISTANTINVMSTTTTNPINIISTANQTPLNVISTSTPTPMNIISTSTPTSVNIMSTATPEYVISTATSTPGSISTTSTPTIVPITTATELTGAGFPIGSWYVEYVHHN